MRVVVIGAGPTGLAAAHRLHERGREDFVLYERASYVGGLAASFRDARGFLWDFAVHVAHSHYDYVDELMDRLLPDGYYHCERSSWVRQSPAFIPYPYQYNLGGLPEERAMECLHGLQALLESPPAEAPENFNEWILATFGAGIAKHFMQPYNAKLWSIDLERMGYQWIADRVPVPDLERVRRSLEPGRDALAWGPNATFQFPKTGGTGAIWRALADRLPAETLRLSNGVVSIDPRRRVVRLEDGSEDRYDRLVSTVPIPALIDLCGLDGLRETAARLRHNHVYVVCVACEAPTPEALRGKTWIYCPDDGVPFYRVTPFSNFSPDHVPDPDGCCSLLCEISEPGTALMHDGRRFIGPTLEGLRDLGFTDDLLAKSHARVLRAEHGYPVPTTDRDEILAALLEPLGALGIYSRGRFGGWKYEVSNMDHSVMQGVEAVDHILDGTGEVTLFDPDAVNAGRSRRTGLLTGPDRSRA